MKKIIALFIMMLAFGINANAQQKKAAATVKKEAAATTQKDWDAAAAKDVEALGQVITFEGTQKADFNGLFEHKHRTIAGGLNAEGKADLARIVEAKIKATLTPAQHDKLAKSPKVLDKITH